MEPYRILVVDDSAFMRAIFSDLILLDPAFAVIGTACDGEEAVEAVRRLKPDAVTLDLEMPRMNGIEALQLIMKEAPTPVIMLSGISEQNMRETIKALQCGAFDFIRKPTSAVSDDIGQVGELLIEKLKIAVLTGKCKQPALQDAAEGFGDKQEESAPKPQPLQPQPPNPGKDTKSRIHKPNAAEERSAVDASSIHSSIHKSGEMLFPLAEPNRTVGDRKPKERKQPPGNKVLVIPEAREAGTKRRETSASARGSETFRHIVAIGTSTGGPRALHEVISALPPGLPAPVLVVQHMPPKFTKSLAQRLDSFSGVKVVEAGQAERVRSGVVYIAPGGYHMELGKDAGGYCIKLTQQPPRNGHRPAVDVLFESLVPYRELERHAVLMTGMGSDGAKGMAALAGSGAASTIAEAEETCIVYGMPRCAVENGAAKTVLPLQRIAPALVSCVSK